jgi:predicted  nucleic acid-binding Zn-ribbon protein
LRDQLKRLEELQRYDAQIQELTNALKAIPAKLEASQSDFARVESLLDNERTQLAESQRYYAEQKSQLQTDESSATGAKSKLSMAKNSKEYMAAQREMEQTRESVQNREQEIAKLIEAVQVKEKLLAERATELEGLRKSIDKDAEVGRKKMAELEGKIAEIKVDRDKVAAGIRPDVLKRYGAIRMRRGLAVTTVRNGTCQGCNMNVPPQLYNVLQRGNTIETCPYCHRIVYWENLMKDDPQTPPAGSPPAT